MASWVLPKITDYWDANTGAIERMGDALAQSADVDADLLAIAAAIAEHVRVFSDSYLLQVAVVVADDLYKSANALSKWTESHNRYLAASAGSFFALLKERGYVLHYGVDNSFKDLYRPFELFPAFYAGAGLVYVCPQEIAMKMIAALGERREMFAQYWPRYAQTARQTAADVTRRCHGDERSYILLDLDAVPETFEEIMMVSRGPGVLTVLRDEAPVPGSKVASLFPARAVGLTSGAEL